MKKIGFIGAYEKIDFILYVARILVEMGQRVIVVDATITQKGRYVVPNIQATKSYVTEYEGIDVAVGLRNLDEIKACLGISAADELPYDIAFIDTDSAGGAVSYKINECEKVFFVTSFDVYSIKRGIESLAMMPTKINATKILFSRSMKKEDDDYLNFLSSESNVIWNPETIYLPFEMGDQTVIYRNQRVEKIILRDLTNQYKEGLIYTIIQIVGEERYQEIRKAFKKIEKGV